MGAEREAEGGTKEKEAGGEGGSGGDPRTPVAPELQMTAGDEAEDGQDAAGRVLPGLDEVAEDNVAVLFGKEACGE
jgi:hypothetical protein